MSKQEFSLIQIWSLPLTLHLTFFLSLNSFLYMTMVKVGGARVWDVNEQHFIKLTVPRLFSCCVSHLKQGV